MGRLKRRGQNLMELALCLVVISAAFAGMTVYLRRGFQARLKAGADDGFQRIRQEATARNINFQSELQAQYEPYYHEARTVEDHRDDSTTGFPNRLKDETRNRSGWERVYAR